MGRGRPHQHYLQIPWNGAKSAPPSCLTYERSLQPLLWSLSARGKLEDERTSMALLYPNLSHITSTSCGFSVRVLLNRLILQNRVRTMLL
ncbi:hypothetical protein EMPG_13862 [Blastomyces silverae]|uniref:Uncharacterized protein n=1 Tax=Blastomyces silverae TaxID=2060906 RepID=A0A0H1BGX7_9EURO|nr:hypothetical protein EMPG_13862 [Blastomyces silverae]